MSDVNLNQKIICKNCTEDIFSIHTVLFQCSTCPNLELCPDCFCNGAILGEHRRDHPFRIVDNAGYSILGTEWTANEHMQLLDNVEQYGFGNWGDIAKHISQCNNQSSAQKNPENVKNEFNDVFISGSLGDHTWDNRARGRAEDHTTSETHQSSSVFAPANLTLTESILLGYMPKRDDYEMEFDNDAETLVSHLQIGSSSIAVPVIATSEDEQDIDEVDKALMAAHVDMYIDKLKERERRKKISREHGLINQYFREVPALGGGSAFDRRGTVSAGQRMQKKDSRSGAGSGDLLDRLKCLARIQSLEDYNLAMGGFSKEKDLKSRIKELMRFRKNGVISLKDSTEYEIQRLRRLKKKNEMRKRMLENSADSVSGAANSPFRSIDESGSPLAALSPSKNLLEDKFNSIIGLPGYEMLSLNEKKLCCNLKLTPAQYISYKTSLLTNHLQKKKGQTPKPINPEGLDKNNRKIVFQFFIRSGWINAY